MKCQHGHDGTGNGTAGKDEISSCCGAPVTYSGDGDLYCKCCFGLIEWTDGVSGITIDLKELK